MTKKERVIYFDYMRVFAIIAVIVLHVAAENWVSLNVNSFEWDIFNFYDSITRWGVPIFVMISGSLFLEREIETKKLYSEYILRMIISYFVWSIFYAFTTPLLSGTWHAISFKSIITDTLGGAFHMWFIPMITGLYMCIPLIRPIAKTKETSRYYLILSFIFAFVVPEFVNISNHFFKGTFPEIVNYANVIFYNMNMHFVFGYVFYFLLGHELNRTVLTKKQRKVIYLLGAVGFLLTIILSVMVSHNAQSPCDTFYQNSTVNVAFEALAVFTWFKYRKYNNKKLNAVMAQLSKYCFGAYLIHIFVRDVLTGLGFNTLTFSPVVSVPVISVIIIAISFTVSFVINKIPFINKWII